MEKNINYYISMDKVSKGTMYTILPAKYIKLVECFTSYYDTENREVHITPKLSYDDIPKVHGVDISINYEKHPRACGEDDIEESILMDCPNGLS